jgi:hypothetical protein
MAAEFNKEEAGRIGKWAHEEMLKARKANRKKEAKRWLAVIICVAVYQQDLDY